MKTVYLDNNATTQCLPEVIEAMLPYFGEKYGNASSMHTFGGSNRKAIDIARQQVADLIGAQYADEIIFTSCASESDNTAILSAVRTQPKKKHIITSAVEHPAVMEPFKYLEVQGYRVDFIGVDEKGNFDMARFKEVLDEDTALVSVMWANSETGTLFPVEEIARLAKQKGALFHTDAVQAVGKVPVNVSGIDIDMLSLSAHKIHGPKGVGVLYVRRGGRFMPFLMGGHQEKHRRAGTENVPGIVGLGVAAVLAKTRLQDGTMRRVAALRDRLEQGLTSAIADTKINGNPAARVPNTTNISFGYIEGESILMFLNDYGICASSGSACTSGSLEPSHVLRAMGVPFQFAHGSIRFSLSDQTTQEDIDLVLKVMPGIVEKLRKISPFSRIAA